MENMINNIHKYSSEINEIELYSNKHIVLNVSWTDRPLFGVLDQYDSKFLMLRKKDGRIQTIRRKAVLSIEEQREMV